MICVTKLNKKKNQRNKSKMRSIYILLALLVIINFSSNAQPGYMGKTLSVSYNLNTSPILIGPSYNGNQNPLSSFNTIHSLRIDKVVTRKKSLGLEIGFTRTSLYKMEDINQGLYKNFENGFPYKLYSYKFGGNIRKHFNDDASLAPFGQYYEFGFGVNNNVVIDALIDDVITNSFVPYISLAFGTQRIIANRYLFDLSLRFTFYPKIFGNNFEDEYSQSLRNYNSNTNSYDVEHSQFVTLLNKNALKRIQMLDLITFKIGVGTLIK